MLVRNDVPGLVALAAALLLGACATPVPAAEGAATATPAASAAPAPAATAATAPPGAPAPIAATAATASIAAAAPALWEPADPTFKGCEGG